jgi:acyl carrier protein phosphodiesterase
MNFLAHAVFADGPNDIVFGSLAGDFVGKMNKDLLPINIRYGLSLHSDLDIFFDNLEFTKSRQQLRDAINHYQSPVLDICCDHILISNWKKLFENVDKNYIDIIYSIISEKLEILPTKGQNMMRGLVKEDWFTTYGTKEGLTTALTKMSYRSVWGEIIRDNIGKIIETIPTIKNELFTELPTIRQHTQDYIIKLGYQPEGRIQWKEKF